MNGFYIQIKNGLLKDGHRQRMENAVWLFLWLLDRMTIINYETGVGQVLGGKPVKYEDVNEELQIPERTYRRWIARLKEYGYINVLRTPAGLVLSVNKPFKIFKQKVEGATNGTSDMPQTAHLGTLNGTSNIRQYKDKTVRQKKYIKKYSSINDITPEDIQEIATRYNVSIGFVSLQLEKLSNWTQAKGRTYRNYKKALQNWVLGDVQKQVERKANGTNKVSIDTNQL